MNKNQEAPGIVAGQEQPKNEVASPWGSGDATANANTAGVWGACGPEPRTASERLAVAIEALAGAVFELGKGNEFVTLSAQFACGCVEDLIPENQPKAAPPTTLGELLRGVPGVRVVKGGDSFPITGQPQRLTVIDDIMRARILTALRASGSLAEGIAHGGLGVLSFEQTRLQAEALSNGLYELLGDLDPDHMPRLSMCVDQQGGKRAAPVGDSTVHHEQPCLVPGCCSAAVSS